jgi:hypothetical protein
MGLSLYDKVPDQIKLKENISAFKMHVKTFMLKHSFYSVDEFMSF